MPRHLRVSVLTTVHVDDRILGVRLECIPIIVAESNVRRLQPNTLVRVVGNGVEGHHAIVLIWEEAGSVVGVDDRATGEDVVRVVVREERYLLVRPMVQILRRCVAPMLVCF